MARVRAKLRTSQLRSARAELANTTHRPIGLRRRSLGALSLLLILLGGAITFAGDPAASPSLPPWERELSARQLLCNPTRVWLRGDDETQIRIALADLSADFALAMPTLEATPVPRTWWVEFEPTLAKSSLEESIRLEVIDQLDQHSTIEWAAPELFSARLGARFAPNGEIIVVAKSWAPATIAAARRACERRGFEVVRTFPTLPHVFVVDSERPARSALEDATLLQNLPAIAAADPNWFGRANGHTTPNDPLFPLQWAHDNTGQSGGTSGADLGSIASWTISTGAPAIRVAVLDAGVDPSHPDLVGNLDPGYDATDEAPPTVPGSPRPEDFHGTACAGIIGAAGDNGLGVAGLAWQCRVIPVRVGYGLLFTQSDWVIDAVTWATGQADVISGSWGGLPPTAGEEAAFENATNLGRAGLGCVVVFSAGNNGVIEFPAAYPQTVAVGASSPLIA
ncbi:MAG: S8 family serine peptidase, partial [Planctomycetota bacterium]